MTSCADVIDFLPLHSDQSIWLSNTVSARLRKQRNPAVLSRHRSWLDFVVEYFESCIEAWREIEKHLTTSLTLSTFFVGLHITIQAELFIFPAQLAC